MSAPSIFTLFGAILIGLLFPIYAILYWLLSFEYTKVLAAFLIICSYASFVRLVRNGPEHVNNIIAKCHLVYDIFFPEQPIIVHPKEIPEEPDDDRDDNLMPPPQDALTVWN